MKPILFNTEMVRAILDGRKTVTRRVVRFPDGMTGRLSSSGMRDHLFYPCGIKRPPYHPGDILYVRETWNYGYCDTTDFEYRYNETFFEELPPGEKDTYLMPRYFYRTEDLGGIVGMKWRPSIHMPKEAARLFLRVTEVRAERLQEITEDGAIAEGVPDDGPMNPVYCPHCKGERLVEIHDPATLGHVTIDCPYCKDAVERYKNLWNSTVKKSDRPRYGWAANPWVWVIEFDQISKDEAMLE